MQTSGTQCCNGRHLGKCAVLKLQEMLPPRLHTDFKILLLIYILGLGYTRDLLLLHIPGVSPLLLQLVYSLSKSIG